MKEDFSELIQYLDEKFNKVDEEFIKINERLVGVDNKLDNLQESKVDKSDFNQLVNSVDAYAKKA